MQTLTNTEPADSSLCPDEAYGYGPLVSECRRRGIGRTMAYDLQKRGLIETFTLGRKRMVKIASLESLPERLLQAAANDG